MSIGESGRIVIEIEPAMKKQLHATLSREGLTLKNWFVARAEEYLVCDGQMTIFDKLQDRAVESVACKGKE